MLWDESIKAIITSLGIGLMIGVIRERRDTSEKVRAGARTYTLIAALGSISWLLGPYVFITSLAIVGALAVGSYLHSAKHDSGLTGEVTMVLTLILSAMAHRDLTLTAGLGVLFAILLKAKSSIHRMSKEIISEQEVGEALLILAAALIVLPLLPGQPIDPWGVVELDKVWRIVVLIMAMGMLGHVARRALGAKLGFPMAGFFSGFASSTAAVASLGQRARLNSKLVNSTAAAAMAANLSSLFLLMLVVGTVSPKLLNASKIPLLCASVALILVAVFFVAFRHTDSQDTSQGAGQSFKLHHAVLIAVAITAVSLISYWLNQSYGETGVLIATAVAAAGEIHAAAASLGQMTSTGEISLRISRWGIFVMIGSSFLAKAVLAFVSGGKRYGQLVTGGLILTLLALALGVFIS